MMHSFHSILAHKMPRTSVLESDRFVVDFPFFWIGHCAGGLSAVAVSIERDEGNHWIGGFFWRAIATGNVA
jgi:hypothetical protein